MLPKSARQVTFVNGTSGSGSTTCANGPQGGVVSQTLGEGCTNIPGVTLGSSSYVDDSGFTQTVPTGITLGSTDACVSNPALTTPVLSAPPFPSSWGDSFDDAPVYTCVGGNTGLSDGEYQPGVYECPLTVDHPLAPGMYVIQHEHGSSSNDVEISQSVTGSCTASETSAGYTVCLDGVTFYGENNSAGEAPTIDVTSKVVVEQTPACSTPRASATDCVFPLYAPIGVAMAVNLSKNGTDWVMQGSLYDPSGAMSIGQNARTQIDGQAIVQQWNDQSGAHPDPAITFSGSLVAPETEQLRLVE